MVVGGQLMIGKGVSWGWAVAKGDTDATDVVQRSHEGKGARNGGIVGATHEGGGETGIQAHEDEEDYIHESLRLVAVGEEKEEKRGWR